MERGFITPLRVESIDECNWRLLEDFSWVGSFDDPLVFTVEAGETTDFATVPWWTQSLIPRTGTWTKAAVLHDKMCNQLNEYRTLNRRYAELMDHWELNRGWGLDNKPIEPLRPRFTSVQTDAIFRKNAREAGTGVIRSELLWFGVRCGALANSARRAGWMSTFLRWFTDLLVILLALVVVIVGISWAWPW